jgi:putative membrane-bound dehydrogenase-like protein
MKLKQLLIPLLLACAVAQAAPPKVAVIADNDLIRTTVSASGAQLVDASSLSTADVLVLQSAKADRAAVEAFIKKGGGLVVIGSGINAGDWLKPLAGAAWTPQSRKFANKMMLFTLTDAHAITRGATPFDLDDETVYDLDLDPTINVLASAFTPKVTGNRAPRPGDSATRANVYDLQPQMWTYESAGKHRAFVLLQNDPASLQHASIRSFILRGIAWAAGLKDVDELCAKEDLATLRYPKGGARTAAETAKTFEMQPGFRASVVASEPLITKPIAMQWDARGHLWVAETPEYPNGRRPLTTDAWKETGVLEPGKYDRPAKDRISILSEPNELGEFTKKTVFYEGLELVTAFCLYGDGVITVAQPDILYIHGEGAEQKVERLYTGFAPGDTHFVANHFIAAPDGWIYANSGSGANAQSVAHPEVTGKTSSGVFRFKPDGTAIEQVSSKGGNAFGLDISDDGEIFWGQATSGQPLQHVVLPESILAKAKVGSAGSAESVIKGRKVMRSDLPTRAPFMQIDQVGGYSSACASTLSEGGAWPSEWKGGIFCTEPILDIIHFEKLVPSGPTFIGQNAPADSEWLRAQDFWFFPVDVEFGPDGAMYVLDFYCPIVAHNDTRGPLHSKSGASVRPDRDHFFGRIYRIQADGAKPTPMPDLSKATLEELAVAFYHPNRLVRFTAHRLLMERPDAASIAPMLMSMTYPDTPAPARILSLWALQRLGLLSPEWLRMALETSDVGVKKSALLVAEAMGTKNTVDLSAMLNDPEPRVRLLALRAIASSPITPESAAELLAILPKLEDDWSRSAAAAAASSNPGPVLVAALNSSEKPSNALLDLAGSLARGLGEAKDRSALTRIISAAATAPPSAAPLIRIILATAAQPVPPGLIEGDSLTDALRVLLSSPDQAIAASALPYAIAWQPVALKAEIAPRITAMLSLVADSAQPDAARAAAVHGLLLARAADAKITPALIALLSAKLSDALVVDVIGAIASTGDPAFGKPLVKVLTSLSPIGQNAAYDALTSRADWTNTLLDAFQANELKPTILGPARLSRLRLHSDPATAKRALKVIDEIGGGTNPAKDEVIAKLEPLIESKPGNAAIGKAFFNTTCGICHKLNGEGKEVGPALDGMGVHGTHDLLVHIIDPSRVVDDEHRTWNIALKNGSFATGIIGRENDRSVTLRLPGGVEQEIKVADIKSRQNSGLSLMPEGLEALGADMLRDILAYMSGGTSKYRALNLGRAFTNSTLGGLYNSREAKNDTVHPAKYGVVTVEGVPFSLPDPSTTPTGGNVIVLQNNAGGKTLASSMPQRVEIPVGYAAGNLHFLGGVAGWGGGPDMHKPAMKLTIEHSDGKKEVDELNTGEVFIDYNSRDEVPGSKRASGVTKQWHVRYFSVPVNERSPITKLVLESYKNGISATTLAITTDNEPPKPMPKFSTAPPAAPAPKRETELPKSGDTLPAKAEPGTIRALLVGGGSSHDFGKYFHQADSATLQAAGKITTAYTSNAEEALALLANADVLVLSANHPSFGTPDFQHALNAFADAGHGCVIVHAGVWYNWPPVSGYNKRFVGGGARGHGKGEFTVYIKAPKHPVMEGVPAEFKISDEHYRVILDEGAPVELLAETEVEKATGKAYPSVWVSKDPKAKFLNIALGHDAAAHSNPAYQKILVNAVRWVAGK